MATLVLSGIGSILAGPPGAAIGAIIGNQVDRTLLAPKVTRTGPRLTDLAVQTSRYGEQLPRVWGRMRVAGCVIWSTDLIETKSKSGGGKGQPSTTTYSYAASFAVALSARRVSGVGRVWADGKLLRGVAGDWKSKVGAFRLHIGGEDQAVDPLIASAVGIAPAHRGIGYAVFEQLQLADFGNRIPSLTFELIADDDAVSVGAMAMEVGAGAIASATAGRMIEGFAAGGNSIAGTLEVLGRIGGFDITPSEGALALEAPSGPPAAIGDDLAVRWTRRPIDTVPRALTVAHYEPARDYQIGVQSARRPGAGWREEAVEVPAVLDASAARGLADRLLLRAEAENENVRVTAAIDMIDVAPGRVVTLTGDARRWRVVRSEIEGHAVLLDLLPIAEDDGAAVTADSGAPPPALDEPVGETVMEAFELPPLSETLPTAPQLLVAAGGSSGGWRGAVLEIGGATGGWSPVGTTAAAAIIGTVAAPLPRAGAALEDRANVIEVTLAHDGMALASANAAAVDLGANLALVGDELVQFAIATQLASARWRLSGLRRGVRATAPAAHDAGTRFVLIEADALAALTLPGRAPGDVIDVLASGVGDDGVVRSVVLSGTSIAPPAPVHLAAEPLPDGGARVTWVRRSRAGWRWLDSVDAPLVEERERYRVVIQAAGGTRTLITESPAVAVTAGERLEGTVSVEVFQLGTLGASRPAMLTI